MVDEAIERATNTAAATGSGGNIENEIRKQFRNILNSPKQKKGFSEDELDAMRAIVRGTDFGNIARLVGKLSPNGSGLMLALQAGGGAASGGATLPLAAMGAGAKAIADKSAHDNVYALARIIRAGGDASKTRATENAVQRLPSRNAKPSPASSCPGASAPFRPLRGSSSHQIRAPTQSTIGTPMRFPTGFVPRGGPDQSARHRTGAAPIAAGAIHHPLGGL